MNLFEIDYLGKTYELVKELLKFKKYRAMHPVLAVFCGIIMIPFVLASISTLAALSVCSFMFKAVKTPIDFLRGLLKDESRNVMHATQFIMYLISWPIIFVGYALLSVTLIFITILYAELVISSYIWSLGGFKFHLFITEANDLEIEVNSKYRKAPLIFVIISAVLLILVPAVHGFVHYAELYADYREHYFTLDFYPFYIYLTQAFAFVYSLAVFSRNPKELPLAEPECEECCTSSSPAEEIKADSESLDSDAVSEETV